jgi:hypothetical protein
MRQLCRRAGLASAFERRAHRLDDVLFRRKTSQALFGHHLPLDGNFEDAAATGNELGFDAERLLEGGRRTGGPGQVASDVAVGNRHHGQGG